MKNKILLLTLTLALSAQVFARVFETGERMYFNGSPSSFSTWKNDADLWGQFIKGSDDYWIKAQWHNGVPYLEIPAGAARDWTHIVLARFAPGKTPFSDSPYNKTGSITIYEYKNYMENFCYGDGWKDANWGTYIPAPTVNPESWSLAYDDEQICTSAAGTTYVLAPKNYDYSGMTDNHEWFVYNGSTWTRLQGANEFSQSDQKDYSLTLDVAGSDHYYFYQCSKPSMCRLVRIRLNKDCSDGAEGACAITSFIGVASEANVTDETSAIDGLVAFDDKKNAGKLMVWSPGVDTVIIENDDIETPQTFKLENFPAPSYGGAPKTYTLYAKFLDGVGCEAAYNVTVYGPTAEPKTHTTTGTSSDLRLIRFTEENVTFTPDNQTSTHWRWTNSDNDDKILDTDPGAPARNYTFTAPTEQKDINYVFLAANEPEAAEGNLISNGTFETADNLESNYDYWGKDQTNYYTSHPGASGGYALTQNSTSFWPAYNAVTAHEGNYFGLFDSKIYDGTDQAAWIARHTNNPKLKVQEGVSYLFSFWVANINNFGEMNNGARLQFQISYDNGSTWNNLGSEINLNDYKDNRWHGRSSIAVAPKTTDEVILRVININESSTNRGNDFALDDIRFEAVTSRSTNVAAYEIFPVKYLKCVITDASFSQRQPVGCGTTVADVDYTINYVNPRGDLYIYEGSTLLAKINHDDLTSATHHTGVLKDRPVDNADHELTVYFKDALVQTDAPTTYTYNAKAVPAISVKSLTWNAPACDVTTCSLTAVISYTNQNGTLTANVDGGTAVTQTYTVESDDNNDVTITIPGVVADGKTGHKLTVTFSGSHGCSIVDYDITEAAPYSPNISAYTATIQPYACGEGTMQYQVKAEATFSNGQGHNIVFEDWKGNKQTLTTLPTDTKAETTFNFDWETPASRAIKVYFVGAEACADNHPAAFTSPAKPEISVAKPSFTAMDCNKTTYTLTAAVTYTNQNGSLNVWLDDDVANKQSFTYNTDKQSADVVNVVLSNLIGDGAAHKLNVEFEGSKGCRRVVADDNAVDFTAPFAPVISAVKVTPQDMKCSETSYSVTIDATLSENAVGKTLTVESDNGTNTYTIASTTFSQTYTVAQASAAGKFRVYFNDADNCAGQKTTDYTYTVPTIPTLIVNAVSVPTPACDQTTFNLNVTGSYNYQHGSQLEFYWDSELKTTQTILPLSAGAIDVTLSGLVYDGNTHTLLVKTDNDVFDCDFTQSSISVPFMPAIASVKAMPTQMTCGVSTYDVEVSLNVTNGQGKNVTVSGKGQTKSFAASEGANSVTFTGIGVDAAADQFEIWFADATDCSTHKVATYTEPVVPQMSVATPSFSAMDCNKTTYSLSAVVTYINQNGTLTAWVDGGAKQTFTYEANQPTEKTVAITIADLAGDGVAHKLNVEFDGSHGCRRVVADDNAVDFTAPFAPVISAVKVTPQDMKCSETSYSVTIDATLSENAVGKTLTVESDNGTNTYTIASTTFSQTYTVAQASATGKFRVYFNDADNCAGQKTTDYTYTVPTTPTLTVNAVTIPAPVCGQTTFSIDVAGDFSNLHGTQLEFYWDGALKTTQTLATPIGSISATLSGLSYDDGHHTLLVKTDDDVYDCEATQSSIFVQGTPYIGAITLQQPTQLSCGQDSYEIEFQVESDYQEGALQVLDEANNVLYQHNNPAPAQKGTIVVAADGKSHNLNFKFTGVNDCQKTASYDALGVPTLTIEKTAEQPVECGATQYTNTFTIKYSNQSTQLTLRDFEGNVIQTWLPDDEGEFTEVIPVTRPLTADQKDSLIVEFASAGAGAGIVPCSQKIVYNLPAQHGINSFGLGTPSYTDACGTKYEIPFTISYIGLTGDLILADASRGDMIVWQGSAAQGKTDPLDATVAPEAMNLHAWFADNTACVSDIVPVTSLPRPTLAVAQTGSRIIDFTNSTFTEQIEISFQYQEGKTLYVKTDGNELAHYDAPVSPIVYTYTGNADNKPVALDIYFGDESCKQVYNIAAQPAPVFKYNDPIMTTPACDAVFTLTLSFEYENQMPGVSLIVEDENGNALSKVGDNFIGSYVADGQEHTFTLYFDNNPAAKWTYKVTYPVAPSLSFVSSSVSALDADTMYIPTVSFSSVHLTGTLVVEDENGNLLTPTSTAATNFVLPAVKADGQLHSGNFWFAECPTLKAPYTYQSPAVPQLDIVSAIENVGCDGNYDAVFTITYANQEGNLIVADEEGQVLDTYTQGNTTEVWRERVVADGSEYQIQVWFDGGARRVATATLTAPIVGVVNVLTTDTMPIVCNDATYSLKVHAEVQNPNSDLIIECDGVQKAVVALAQMQANPAVDLVITDLPTASPVVNVRALFSDRPNTDCYMEVAALRNVPRSCLEYADTICAGSDYAAHGYVATALAAGDIQTQVADSIINIHVVPQPTFDAENAGRVCSSEANMEIAYSATGESDIYSVTFSDSQFTDVVDASLTAGTITLSLPDSLKPGKYSATISIGHHATDCGVSDVVEFEISAGDMLYSKWNDVLLVANRDGLFTSYQWYHNGERMDGETQQRLYNPADMTGSFYCEVTMEDGTVFTTCDGEFSQAPYSRDQNTVTPTQTQTGMPILVHRATSGKALIGVYSVTGQQVDGYETNEVDYTITAPSTPGVYVIMITTQDAKWTQKVMIK